MTNPKKIIDEYKGHILTLNPYNSGDFLNRLNLFSNTTPYFDDCTVQYKSWARILLSNKNNSKFNGWTEHIWKTINEVPDQDKKTSDSIELRLVGSEQLWIPLKLKSTSNYLFAEDFMYVSYNLTDSKEKLFLPRQELVIQRQEV